MALERRHHEGRLPVFGLGIDLGAGREQRGHDRQVAFVRGHQKRTPQRFAARGTRISTALEQLLHSAKVAPIDRLEQGAVLAGFVAHEGSKRMLVRNSSRKSTSVTRRDRWKMRNKLGERRIGRSPVKGCRNRAGPPTAVDAIVCSASSFQQCL